MDRSDSTIFHNKQPSDISADNGPRWTDRYRPLLRAIYV
jgi:hypothetical protein